MGIKVTEFQKGRAKFEKLFKSGAINSAGIKITLSNSEILEIFDKGSCEMLDTLNYIGEHFAKSWHTRLTSHKRNDFALLQSVSSLNLQNFYADAIKAYNEYLRRTNSPVAWDELVPIRELPNEELKKELSKWDKKIERARKELLRAVNSDPNIRDAILKAARENPSKNGKKIIRLATDGIDPDIEFIDPDSQKVLSTASIKTYSETVLKGTEEHELAVILSVTGSVGIVGVVGALIGGPMGVGVGLGLFAILFIGSIIVSECIDPVNRFLVIKNKRYITRVRDQLTKLKKCMNGAAKFKRDFVKNIPGRSKIPPFGDDKIPTEVIKVTTEFVNMQKKLWEPYTTATGREYDERFKLPHGEHVSGMRSVPDTKQHSEIGRAKLGLANTWVKMSVTVGT